MEKLVDNAIIVKSSGGAGIGDRLFSLATALIYAKHSERAVFIDWRDRAYMSSENNLFPFLFQIKNIPSASWPDTDSIVPSLWKGRLDLSLDQMVAIDLEERGICWEPPAPPKDINKGLEPRYSIDPGILDYKEAVVVLSSSRYLHRLLETLRTTDSTFASMTPYEVILRTIREELKIHPDLQKEINEFNASSFKGSKTIGVHIRQTKEAAAVRKIPGFDQYCAAINRALDVVPNAKIFVATDNLDVQSDMAARYGEGKVFWQNKWLPETGEPIHKNINCPSGLDAARHAVIDIGILASCDYLIMTGHSSFSAIAHAFSTAHASSQKILFLRTPLKKRCMGRLRNCWKKCLAP